MIYKYNSGGMAYLPTTSGSSGFSQSTASSSEDEANKVPGFAKELIAIVKESGLDNDVDNFLGSMTRLLDRRGDPTGESLTMRDLVSAQRLASRVKTNYAYYQKVTESLDKENAWGEAATDKNGKLYVIDKESGKIQKVTANSYDPSNHEALTNQDIMELRRKSPQYIYNTNLLDDLNSAVGMDSVITYIKERIKDFGKTKITGYSEKQRQKIASGLEHIVAGDLGDFRGIITTGPDGLYKITSESTLADTGIKEAAQFLFEALPISFKNTLIGRAAVSGYRPDAMLLELLQFNTDRTLAAEYDDNTSKATGYTGSDAGGLSGAAEDDYLMRLAAGDFGPAKDVRIIAKGNNPQDNGRMTVRGWDTGAMIGYDKHTLPQSTVKQLLTTAWGLNAGNTGSITFGNRVLTDGELNGVMWDGRSHLEVAQLPYTHDEAGHVVPNFKAIEKIDKLNQFIKRNPNATEMDIRLQAQQLFEDPSKLVYDKESKRVYYIENETMPFLTFQGIANGHTIDLDNIENFLEPIEKSEGKMLTDSYNNLIHYGKLYPDKNDKETNDYLSDAKSGDFYKGNVYIPIESPWQGFNASTVNQYYPKDTFTNVSGRMAVRDAVVKTSEQDKDLKLNW